MTENTPIENIENEMRSLFTQNSAPEPFLQNLRAQLNGGADQQSLKTRKSFILRPVWLGLTSLLIVLIAATLVIGPQRVYAEVRRLLGYIPGVGLVDSSAPIRVLAEPVEQTRDGVTITVTSAVLTADRTHIEYRVFGVARDAYPTSEDVSGCMQQEYLRLPDGRMLSRMQDYPAIPANVKKAVLVILCIGNTLPGKAPKNWTFRLRFVPAPADMTVMPVEEVTQTPPPAAEATEPPFAPVQPQTLAVNQVIDTETGYVLIVSFNPNADPALWIQQTGVPVITDAAGNKVAYSMPLDIQNSLQPDENGGDLMSFKIDAAGVAFPLTFHYYGVSIAIPQPDAQASFVFDAGSNPQPGQEWVLNQDIELAGHTLTLTSVDADSRGGYSFHFKSDNRVNGVSVTIQDHTPNGGGGGGGGGMTNGEFSVSLAYGELPSGKLTIILSNLSEVSDTIEWTTQWSPATPRTDLPSEIVLPEGVCANGSTITSLPDLPASISGKALFTRFNEDGTNSLVLSGLDGSAESVLSSEGHWSDLSGDGTKVVYSAQSRFVLQELAAGTVTELTLDGYNPRLSTHGDMVAYVDGNADGIKLYDVRSKTNRQISEQAYSAVVGWAADDSKVYIAAMAAGGSAWQIQSIDILNGTTQPLFIIENGSYKALNADLSRDGQWVVYRGRENSSVYLASIDGSVTRLVVENPGIGTSGIAWSPNGWLAVSSIQNYSNEELVIMLNPETCEAYRLSMLNGSIKGIVVK